jgi:hypothetical protein
MRRFAMVVATLVAVTLGGLAVATPAQAKPRAEEYVAVTSRGDVLHQWYWIDQIEGVIGCAKCLHWIDVKTEVEQPGLEATVKGGIMAGLGQLSEATVAGDERTRARLRADALARFTDVAKALGRTAVTPGAVGYYDPDKGVTVETDTAWLASADQDIVDGVGLLQRSIEDPEPSPWRAAAMRQFDKAFAQISTKKVMEG